MGKKFWMLLALLAALLSTACSSTGRTLPLSSHARALRIAASDPRTVVPIAAGIVFDAANWDRDVSTLMAGNRRGPANKSNDRAADVSDGLLYGAVGAALGTSLVEWTQTPSSQMMFNTSAGGAVNLGVNMAFKSGWNRRRPNREDNKSFYSGHAAHSAWAAASLRYSLRRQGPPPGVSARAAEIGLTLIPAATGALRVAGRKHYPSDVLVGWGAGNFFGTYFGELGHECWCSSRGRPLFKLERHARTPAVSIGFSKDL